jgi:trk system potassium uptake protein TrkA
MALKRQRFVLMGAGEVGFHVARKLDEEGHRVVIIDTDPEKQIRVEEELDVNFLLGSGTQVPMLERAEVAGCDLFIAASDNEEANLVSTLLAKDLGAQRAAVRLETTETIGRFRSLYERLFRADLILSSQGLAIVEILKLVLGHHTHEIDFLAEGRIQLRTIGIQSQSPITTVRLRDAKLPEGSLVVGYLDERHELSIPTADFVAEPGGQAIVLCRHESIHDVEVMFAAQLESPGMVVIAGGGLLGTAIAHALDGEVQHLRVFERDRARAERLAQKMPQIEVICADATDLRVQRAEGVHHADSFIAAMGHDETNLMAGLLAQENGVQKVISTVRRSETSRLWQKVGAFDLVSPRFLAAQHIDHYIRSGYRANMISLEGGALRVFNRQIHAASAVVGASLAEIAPPDGLLVGAVVRGDRVFVPSGSDRLAAGDRVILFVHQSELGTLHLFFPGVDDT